MTGRDCEFECYFEPGQYVILPRTDGIGLKRPSQAEKQEVTLLDNGVLSDILQGALEDIYYRLDTMISNSIDYEEFKEFYDTVGQEMSQSDYQSLILDKYCSTAKGLTLKGFK